VTLLVYAITGSAPTGPVTEANRRVQPIRIGQLTAIVASRRRLPVPSARNLRQYHRTVAAIAAAVPAILPMRFGTLVDEEELASILRSRAASLRAALTRVRGRVQMTIRIAGPGVADSLDAARGETHGGGEAVPHGVAGQRAAMEGPGTRYLRNRLPVEDPAVGRVLRPLRQAVRRWVADEQVMSRAGVASVYHLVPRRSAAAYVRALEQAARGAGLDVRVSGPFPPYAFAGTL
jgi:hypothetical protein